ncbi:MAG TPA: PP2C family protein-serine/threonine phosphatase [Crocinitomicaceae bacterium]|nr:PP2C family protein-serine/threonine phosphatase [Crocinitomicaceae bacterium]
MIELKEKNLEQRLNVQESKLKAMLDISNLLQHNFSLEKVVQSLFYLLKNQFNFEKFAVIYQDVQWEILLKENIKSTLKTAEIIAVSNRFSDITFINSSKNEFLNEFSIVVPIFHEDKAIAYVYLSENEQKKHDKNFLENVEFIQSLVNIIVVSIQNRRMVKMEIAQQAIKKELEVASLLQSLLFPSDLPSNIRMDISAKYKQRHKIGGDYYDFIPLDDDNYAICIADVSGKGIGAAMLMSNFQASVRTLFAYQHFELDFLVKELNKTVLRSSKGEKFITFFIAIYNASTREFKYVNAGHNYPILTNGKKYELLKNGTVGLGMLDELPFIHVGKKVLPTNTTLVLYTDGVVELLNKEGEYFEIDRLVKTVHNFYPLKMEDMNNLIFSKLDEWRGNLDFVDDTAIFSCRFF